VDGVKSLTPKQRINLVNNLKLTEKSQPTRRVMIPKPGTDEKRPLGIPTINDRALQALSKMVLEPEWEAKFEPNSYGFRPGRSCHDAIEAIYLSIKQKAKYVLDADIAKCLDRIDHKALVKKNKHIPHNEQTNKGLAQRRVLCTGGIIPYQGWYTTRRGDFSPTCEYCPTWYGRNNEPVRGHTKRMQTGQPLCPQPNLLRR